MPEGLFSSSGLFILIRFKIDTAICIPFNLLRSKALHWQGLLLYYILPQRSSTSFQGRGFRPLVNLNTDDRLE